MTQFDPVWVSSDAQIAALMRAYAGATLPRKLLGTFAIEPGVAYLRGVFMPWMRIPLIFVAHGQLTLDRAGCEFVPRPFAPLGWRVRGGEPNLTFRLHGSEITAVEPADVHSPVAGFFNIPFTRVRTVHAGSTRDLLLCVGGRMNMPRIRVRSIELRQALEALCASPP